MKYFVTGIGTDVGKTVAAAIIVEALQADYWKPVQAGTEPTTDTATIRDLVSNETSQFHPEAWVLNTPASPHLAAAIDNVELRLVDFKIPESENENLVVEGAGGLHVPLNDQHLVTDLISHLGLEVILVSRNYLGSINHSLLSIEALQSRNIPIKGILFNDRENESTQSYILNYTGTNNLGRIPFTKNVTRQFVLEQATKLKPTLLK